MGHLFLNIENHSNSMNDLGFWGFGGVIQEIFSRGILLLKAIIEKMLLLSLKLYNAALESTKFLLCVMWNSFFFFILQLKTSNSLKINNIITSI